jgi:glycerophosphoryl diester phosphodiesterase
VHVSRDDVVVMFHDPSAYFCHVLCACRFLLTGAVSHGIGLERTTDGKGASRCLVVILIIGDEPCASAHAGLIRERNWYGQEGMEFVRTIKEPKQAIPTFSETLELLMKVRSPAVFPR